MSKRVTLILVLLLAAASGLLHGCMEGGTEIPNEARPGEIKGREFLAGGDPAGGAELSLIPVGYVPGDTSVADSLGALVRTMRAGPSGAFTFEKVPEGVYNLVASREGVRSFRDSVRFPGEGLLLANDTLWAPGSLAGVVRLQPQDDPRSATVHVLGTQVFVNPASDGTFRLADLGAGTYRLKVSTILPEYAPLYREVAIRSGRVDTLAEPLEPFFSGIPVVTGPRSMPAGNGTLILRWNRPAYGKVDAYLVYRDSLGAMTPSETPYRNVKDTQLTDTIYRKNPGPGQHPWEDTVLHPYRYRVKILDLSGRIGPSFGYAEGAAVPPTVATASGLWKRASAEAPFEGRSGASLVPFLGRLWLLGGLKAEGSHATDVWSSSDGVAWTRALDSLPFEPGAGFKATAYQGALWVVGARWPAGAANPAVSGLDGYVWKSSDGIHWASVADPVTDTGYQAGTSDFGLVVFRDRLWVIWGTTYMGYTKSTIRSSADGISWSTPPSSPAIPVGRLGTAVHAGKLWITGGDGMPNFFMPQKETWSSADGLLWAKSLRTLPFLPRYQLALASHSDRLWAIGGSSMDPGDSGPEPRADEVWSSPDGENWILVDAHAPFGKRNGAAVASFKDRLWVVGGTLTHPDPDYHYQAAPRDVWYMETP